ncbi:MAG: sigma-70 family RNA polymerase sigma factor [Planctomycetota bacterium]|nr:sigma-70 family RNA polymerase sigma factor [Planctomycetota bacterium]
MATQPEFSETVRKQVETISQHGIPAVAGLYDLTSIRLVRFAATVTRSQHDAEDAVATALLKVVSEFDLLYRARNPWAFLLQMVRNEALLILRRKKRWRVVASKLGECLADLLIAPAKLEAIESQESMQQVWMAMRRLPTEQAEVVALKIWEEFTFHQIALTLDIPPATAASRYRYGLAKLSEFLGTEIPQEVGDSPNRP